MEVKILMMFHSLCDSLTHSKLCYCCQSPWRSLLESNNWWISLTWTISLLSFDVRIAGWASSVVYCIWGSMSKKMKTLLIFKTSHLLYIPVSALGQCLCTLTCRALMAWAWWGHLCCGIHLCLLRNLQPMMSGTVWGHLSFYVLSVYEPSVPKAVQQTKGAVLMIALKCSICENRNE